jgi:hypothetical protein
MVPMKWTMFVTLLSLTSLLFGQDAIPSGTVLPVQLSTSLNSKASKPGQVIKARVMQDVPLPSGARIPAGSKVFGHILEINKSAVDKGSKISVQFDRLEFAKRTMTMITNLRALASMMDVEQAQVPQSGPDRGTSENSWTTQQIGGDIVYRGGGPVTDASGVVGTPAPGGVLVRVVSGHGTMCRGDLDGNDRPQNDRPQNDRPQALWVFSADACGSYGFDDLVIIHAGRSRPVGEITLASKKGSIDIRSGSGILLRVQ